MPLRGSKAKKKYIEGVVVKKEIEINMRRKIQKNGFVMVYQM